MVAGTCTVVMNLGGGGEACGLDVLADGGFEGAERAADLDRGGWFVGLVEGSEELVLEFGVEDGDVDPVGGQGVAVGVPDPVDQPGQAEPAQVVGHLALAVVLAEVSGDEPAKAFVGEAGDGWEQVAEGAGQSHGAFIPEAQRSGSLALVVGLGSKSAVPMAQL